MAEQQPSLPQPLPQQPQEHTPLGSVATAGAPQPSKDVSNKKNIK